MEYVIGVDTGASKSHLALFNTEGDLIDFRRWGPLNHEALPGSFDQFHEELERFVQKTLAKNNLTFDNITSAVFGIAGVDTKTQHGIVTDIIKEIGFKNFTLANDAFLGIPAGSPSGRGICAINGSGSTIAGINNDGKTLQIGGVGFISADFGGGGMLGEMAVSAVYSELFRRGGRTSMTRALMENLGVKDKHDFVDKISAKFDDGSLTAGECNKMLFKAALEDDKIAASILRNCGKSYADGISAMIDELDFASRGSDIHIVLAGSVFVKGESPLIINTIKENLKNEFPNEIFKYVILKVPPVAGAVFWALCNLGINDKKRFYDKVLAQLGSVAQLSSVAS